MQPLTVLFTLVASGVMAPSTASPPPQAQDLVLTAPIRSWDEALPLGNGMMGSLVWGDGRPLRISLDRADLWDARLVPEFSGPDYKFDVMQRWHREGRVADLLRVYDHPYRRPAPTNFRSGC